MLDDPVPVLHTSWLHVHKTIELDLKCTQTQTLTASRVARNVRARESASMVYITLYGIFMTRRGFCTLCLINVLLSHVS